MYRLEKLWRRTKRVLAPHDEYFGPFVTLNSHGEFEVRIARNALGS